jgi:hypothetical protein
MNKKFTYNDALVYWHLQKHKKLTGCIYRYDKEFLKDHHKYLKYLSKDDYKDLKSWDEKTSKKIIETILSYPSHDRLSETSCGWCLKYNIYNNSSCISCTYGKRNGICGETMSYNKWDRFKYISNYLTEEFYYNLKLKICNKLYLKCI